MYGNYYGFNPYYTMNNGAVPDALNQYKAPYQNQFIPQMPTQQAPQPHNANDMIWVQGEAGAKAYLVAPNTTVTLWDSESPTIYIKTADSKGHPTMRVLDFKERVTESPSVEDKHVCKCGKEFVRVETYNALKEEFDAFKEDFKSFKTELEKQTSSKAKNTKIREDFENA